MLAELILITNIAFNVCYDTEKMVPNLVQYDLEPNEVVRMNPDVAPRRVGPSVVPDTFTKVAWGWFGVRVWFLSNLPKNPARAKPFLPRRK